MNTQVVNFLIPELARPQGNARLLGVVAIALLGALLIGGAGLTARLAQTESATRLATAQTEIENLEALLLARAGGREAVARAEQARTRAQLSDSAAWQRLEQQLARPSVPLDRLFDGLWNGNSADVWLTLIQAQGGGFELQGEARRPAAVSAWLAGLRRLPEFAQVEFGRVQIHRDETTERYRFALAANWVKTS